MKCNVFQPYLCSPYLQRMWNYRQSSFCWHLVSVLRQEQKPCLLETHSYNGSLQRSFWTKFANLYKTSLYNMKAKLHLCWNRHESFSHFTFLNILLQHVFCSIRQTPLLLNYNQKFFPLKKLRWQVKIFWI